VSDLASAAIGVAVLSLADYLRARGHSAKTVIVDRRLASAWFSMTIRPIGWSLPPVWDAIAGDYRCADGWIRLHTNAAHHREAALSILKVPPEREVVAREVSQWPAEALETAVVSAGGCAARMMSRDEWLRHPQGMAVSSDPLVRREETAGDRRADMPDVDPLKPLSGVRVLDMTRVLAGPVATRFLAGFGADVLRIDPPGWDEPNVAPEVTLGKRCARLDLRDPEDVRRWRTLLSTADILISGYRPDALDRLGWPAEARAEVRPGLIDVSLDAYGWSGPWALRRGFDSLVQMSAGIADAGMRWQAADHPVALRVQALDHATGYLMAAMAIEGLRARRQTGRGSRWRTSLAGIAELLAANPSTPHQEFALLGADDYASEVENTGWGPAHRLQPPLTLGGLQPSWNRPATAIGSASPLWL
jgi:hypothetical protein